MIMYMFGDRIFLPFFPHTSRPVLRMEWVTLRDVSKRIR